MNNWIKTLGFLRGYTSNPLGVPDEELDVAIRAALARIDRLERALREVAWHLCWFCQHAAPESKRCDNPKCPAAEIWSALEGEAP